jgi:hypothetical protein
MMTLAVGSSEPYATSILVHNTQLKGFLPMLRTTWVI